LQKNKKTICKVLNKENVFSQKIGAFTKKIVKKEKIHYVDNTAWPDAQRYFVFSLAASVMQTDLSATSS
jgi:hypothetical protein